MNKGFRLKVLVCSALAAAVAFLGFTGSQLVAQNKALSEQISELSKQVQDLQASSETLRTQVELMEKRLEPRVEPLVGYNQ